VTGNRYLLLESQIPSHIPGRMESFTEALRQYDTKFEARWFGSWFMDPIWSAPIPEGYSLADMPQKHLLPPDVNDTTTGLNKRAKLAGKKMANPDFINRRPPMEMVVPVPRNKTATATMINRFQSPIPFPRLPCPNGTSHTICLNSAFSGPSNCCVFRYCGDNKSVPRMDRLHIDLSMEPWRSKPESYWDPLISFLQHDIVRRHVRPSRAFRLATPSTTWD
jgi:hypothetical protein